MDARLNRFGFGLSMDARWNRFGLWIVNGRKVEPFWASDRQWMQGGTVSSFGLSMGARWNHF